MAIEEENDTLERSPVDEPPVDDASILRAKIFQELDGHETMGKSGYVKKDYKFAYNEYKAGLKACSDLLQSSEAKKDKELRFEYAARRRKFCINAAAACIKIHHYAQGLEACTLVLEELAKMMASATDNGGNCSGESGCEDTATMRTKALYRSGVCARGMGELDAAKKFLERILEEGKADALTERDVKIQLRDLVKEQKRYKNFAREMCNPNKENEESIILPEKTKMTSKQYEKFAEAERKRGNYLESKRTLAESEELTNKEVQFAACSGAKLPEIMMSEEDCILALDALAKRYADTKVQNALKGATLDHEFKFSKGFIIRSKMILAPIQQDIFEKYGFLNATASSGNDGNSDNSRPSIANTKSHDKALQQFQCTVRYLAKSNNEIAKKADLCQRLAMGDIMMSAES